MQRESVAALLYQRTHLLDRVRHQLGHIHRFVLQSNDAAGHPRNVQQIVDQFGHVIYLARNERADLRDTPLIVAADLQQLGGGADGRPGVTQFMRQHAQKFILVASGVTQLFFRFPARAQLARPALRLST